MQYINVKNKNVKMSQTGPRSSDRRFYRAVVLCLGLLSVFLLVGFALSLHYHNLDPGSAADFAVMKDNLTQCLQASDKKLSDVSEERNRLNARLSSLTAERDQLNSRLSSLTAERDQLNIRLTDMTKELNRLQKNACPAGWSMFNLSCYFVSHKSASWEEGREDCKDREADLVVIDNAEEQTFISDFITAGAWIWIGLTDSEEEGTWKWVDGSSLTLSEWAPTQPDNGGGDIEFGEEDCAHFYSGSETRNNWNDLSCNDSVSWICEKKAQQ
ncbi:C-type lectin domain family 10 member A C-type lectin superfamily member 14 Macrophage lectin 2 [Channa argus]|uniref:C-type lectin domain family 10 member A C-type lectin superfamily member 14 Macrophage lectin 2 n=1 Tax=Channa argus TaxID=215402 RepID=A0A6G1PX09_CHAAH|nr:C-type lectin domain family 10 member A C-type lectin superfamily member 14 Macrophage lectin 2 [Channa argus]